MEKNTTAWTLDQLYRAASDEQADALDALQVRLRWLWRCECRTLNIAEAATCEHCGKVKVAKS